ncbi:hypothetical protein ACFL1B_04185 [Nanoarchaeota archaeon]
MDDDDNPSGFGMPDFDMPGDALRPDTCYDCVYGVELDNGGVVCDFSQGVEYIDGVTALPEKVVLSGCDDGLLDPIVAKKNVNLNGLVDTDEFLIAD